LYKTYKRGEKNKKGEIKEEKSKRRDHKGT
jgi:hypothetical protein